MSHRMIAALACVSALALIQPSAGKDASKSRDYPSVGRVDGYKITYYEEKRFDKYAFSLADRQMPVEGHVISIMYEPDGSQPSASSLEIFRSYNGVLNALGGEVLTYDESVGGGGEGVIGRFTRNGGNVFMDVRVWNNGAQYRLTIVEERSFRPLVQQPGPAPKP